MNLWDTDVFSPPLGGPIPPGLNKLTALWGLDLSVGFSGEIPPELGEMPNLRVLRILSNSLTGCIPSQLQRIDELDIWSKLTFCEDS